MRAMIKTLGAVTVVHLEGYISFESTQPFRKVCLQHLLDKEVVFDFRSLSFVGSCGIQDFLGVLREHRERATFVPRFSGVGVEFRRLLGLAQLNGIEIYQNEEMAILRVQPEVVPFWVDPTPEEELDETIVGTESDVQDEVISKTSPAGSPGPGDHGISRPIVAAAGTIKGT
ncbi:MAG: STAS domain-containing protein [Bdellovibrionales bacterium]|nr:STAS domain-containing protein [Bdellovibrionales bacterium]